MTRSQISPVDAAEVDRLAAAAGAVVPVEQSVHWDRMDEAVAGRRPWRRLVWHLDGEPRAAIALTHFTGRGFTYLWAKHGPVWLVEPTAELELGLRRALVSAVHAADPKIVFVRLHARHRATDLRELLQTVTYDRTVVLDLDRPEDDILASMKKRGRRDVRKALRDESLVPGEETGLDRAAFSELYQLLVETSGRDRFGISAEEHYWTMLDALGPEHARLFVTRREGRALAWGIVTVNDGQATYYYAASNTEGRRAGAADLLVWHMICALRSTGVRSFDLMGIDSDRAPQLTGVRDFKTKFSEEVTEVAGAWDVPVHPTWYAALVAALAGKRRAVAAVRGLPGRARALVGRARGLAAPGRGETTGATRDDT